MSRDWNELIEAQWQAKQFLCVGLDPDLDKIPSHVSGNSLRERIVAFNKAIVEATKDIVACYKPNSAFYEAHGAEGWMALKETVALINEIAPSVPVIFDAKRGDLENTNKSYASAAFDDLGADAITVQPYLGAEALEPFLARADKGVIVLCRTSNPGAGEFQDLLVDGLPLYQRVAKNVVELWNKNGNCALVVGATYSRELGEVRAIAPDMPILIPGVGEQNGDLGASVGAAKRSFLISTSRAILYASSGVDFAEAARAKAQAYDSAIRKAL
ncbi:orotidine-5'-phosphate decarboxylase [Candidatus Kaiserbacteria bacterium]|nr:orotidine-5'-phosphate decarboxylase [Candidatus Kaiserbacteria bacterium]